MQLDTLKEEWEKSLKENRETVDDEQIAEVVSMMSGVPVQRMAQAEGMKLLGMKDDLLSKVIGQDKAIATLVKAIQRSRVGLKDPNKPIGTFMFLGNLKDRKSGSAGIHVSRSDRCRQDSSG